ncbi:MAG: TlpA disulfide reductase family protein [Desulfobacteraceae bacterium]|nr:TlpA disulfide reductase family protein [Desulfobacteraceae bacterium]
MRAGRIPAWISLTLMVVLLCDGACSNTDSPTTNPVQSLELNQFADLVTAETFTGLVVVFATWCSPCRHELPDVAEVYRNKPSQQIQIIAVSVDDEGPAPVQRLVNKLQLPFPVYHVGPALISALRIVGVPTLLVMNKGKLVESSPGQQNARALLAKINKLDGLGQ